MWWRDCFWTVCSFCFFFLTYPLCRLRFISFSIQFLHIFVDGLYEVNLDRRKLKTPGGKLFTVPNEALAIAVATEWDAQRDTLKSYTMHLVWPFTWLSWSRLKFGSQPVFHCFVMSWSKAFYKEYKNICFELHVKCMCMLLLLWL